MAAAVPPIDVHCVHAGPDAPVQGPAAHPLVVATAVLRWGPVAAAPSGAARVQLPHHAMLRVFGRRLRLAAPPAGTPAPMVCPLDLALTGTAWARFLNELLTCGLLDAAPFSSSAALQLAIDRLDVSPAALEVTELDLLPVGGLAAAAALLAGDAAQAQRGAPRRASAAASAARPAAAASAALAPCLAPLACTPLSTLEVEGDAPWTVIAYLSGMLGPCLASLGLVRAAAAARPHSAWRPTICPDSGPSLPLRSAAAVSTNRRHCRRALRQCGGAHPLAPSWALTRHPTVGATQLNDWVNSG